MPEGGGVKLKEACRKPSVAAPHTKKQRNRVLSLLLTSDANNNNLLNQLTYHFLTNLAVLLSALLVLSTLPLALNSTQYNVSYISYNY